MAMFGKDLRRVPLVRGVALHQSCQEGCAPTRDSRSVVRGMACVRCLRRAPSRRAAARSEARRGSLAADRSPQQPRTRLHDAAGPVTGDATNDPSSRMGRAPSDMTASSGMSAWLASAAPSGSGPVIGAQPNSRDGRKAQCKSCVERSQQTVSRAP